MTFRSAALIHKRRQQPRKRIIPGVALAAATIMAAVLLLVVPGGALADVGHEEAAAPTACDGFESLVVTTNATVPIQEAAQSSTSGNCDVNLEVRQLPLAAGTNPCVVTALPSPMGVTGAKVRIRSEGECDEVEINLTTNVGAPRSASRHAQQASSGYASAYAKIVGEDPVGIDMFYNKSKVSWDYTLTSVSNGRHYPSDWIWSSVVWSVMSRASSLTWQGNTSYEGYNYVKFKAVQFTQAETNTTLRAKPGGAFSCAFSIRWKWKTIGMDHHTECDVE